LELQAEELADSFALKLRVFGVSERPRLRRIGASLVGCDLDQLLPFPFGLRGELASNSQMLSSTRSTQGSWRACKRRDRRQCGTTFARGRRRSCATFRASAWWIGGGQVQHRVSWDGVAAAQRRDYDSAADHQAVFTRPVLYSGSRLVYDPFRAHDLGTVQAAHHQHGAQALPERELSLLARLLHACARTCGP